MQIHVVQSGQTLWSIGREYGVLPGLLARFNGLTEPYRLAVGAGHFNFKTGIALHGAAGRHGIPHCAEILAHAERALPAEPGVILAGAAVSGAGAGDGH